MTGECKINKASTSELCDARRVRTDALQQRAVVDVSAGAVAAVSRYVVDTHAVLTHLRLEAFALVHI